MQNCAAESIAEDLLYLTGKALTEGNFDMFATCFELPQLMETVDGRRLLSRRDELRDTFEGVRQHYEDHGVIDAARTVVSAEFVDADTIGSTHVTRLMRAGGHVHRSPFPVYSVIRRFDMDWRIVSSLYVILDSPDHNRALMSTHAPHVAQ